MRHLTYFAILVGCLLGASTVELWPGVRVWRQVRRLALTLLPVAVVFVAWDAFAIAFGHWSFDGSGIVGVFVPGGIPVEELLFFAVVPVCAVLAYEAVRLGLRRRRR